MFTDKTGTGTPGVIDVRSNTAANEILQENHYYAFGMAYEGNWLMNDAGVRDNAYQYNGKEINADFGLNWNDYGARWYDPAIGRWNAVDKLSNEYPYNSTFSYVGNTPVNAIDPDGERIIFVNGYLGFGSPEGGSIYWNGTNSDFVQGAKNYLGDDDFFFTDIKHNSLSTAKGRMSEGEEWARKNYKKLIRGLDKDKDDFKFVTHSMGAAFSEGVIRHLKFMGWNVTQAIHFEAFQAGGFQADIDPPGYGTPYNTTIATTVIDYQLTNDPVLNYAPTNNSGVIKGALASIKEKGKSNWQYRHREPIDSGRVWSELSRLISEALNRDGNTFIQFKE